jgi:pimeloyl-ACP methyl ester carboxylesterase
VPYVQHDGLQLYYEVQGEGPVVGFLHGSGGNHASWWQQVPHFVKAGYRVFTMDLPGFGCSSSDLEEFDTQRHPGDVEAVLDAIGAERAALVGQAIGGTAGLKLAIAHPERLVGVILAHSYGGLESDELRELAAADREEAEKLSQAERLFGGLATPEKAFLFTQITTFNRAKMKDLKNMNVNPPTAEAAAACGVPLLFLGAQQDLVMRPGTLTRAHELVEGSRVELVADAPHTMYWTTPALFNGAVERFLKTVF